MNDIRLGVLVPRSQHFASLGRTWVQGIRLGLQEAGITSPQLRTLDAGSAMTPEKAGDLANEILLGEPVDAVVLLAEDPILQFITPFFTQNEIPVWVSNFGGTAPLVTPPSPWMVRHSFEEWLCLYRSCQETAAGGQVRQGLICDFFEAGFHLPAAFENGARAGGGHMNWLQVCQQDADKMDFTHMLNGWQQEQVEVAVATFNGPAADAFFRWWQQSGHAGRMPLTGNSWLCEAGVLKREPAAAAAAGMKLWAPWFPGLELPAQTLFSEMAQKRTGKQPDAFLLMGYEGGYMLGKAARAAMHESSLPALAFRDALQRSEMDSARGKISMGPNGNLICPQYPCELVHDTAGTRLVQRGEAMSSADMPAIIQQFEPPVGGWWNPYIAQ